MLEEQTERGSFIGMYIRNTSDIPPNWKYMQTCSDMNLLYAIMEEEHLEIYERDNILSKKEVYAYQFRLYCSLNGIY